MCTTTHIKHHHTPSPSVHVRVKYVRCVLEVSDNLSKTHAVLFGCTLRSSHLCLSYSCALFCPIPFLYLCCCQTLQLFLCLLRSSPPFLFFILNLGLQGLHGKSTSTLQRSNALLLPSVHVFNPKKFNDSVSDVFSCSHAPHSPPPCLTFNPSFPQSLSLVIFL